MAKDNKTIGKFKLSGIRRAPAGVPQIEVTFDIDTNGILKVSAKDLGTGQEQSVVITSDERMSDQEIDEAIRESQMYASMDTVRRDAVAMRDEAAKAVADAQMKLKNEAKELNWGQKKQHLELQMTVTMTMTQSQIKTQQRPETMLTWLCGLHLCFFPVQE